MTATGPAGRRERATAGTAAALLLVAASTATAGPEVLRAAADMPRAFGYTVGDVVSRQVELQVPAGLVLDPDSLPRAGARGRALELQRVVFEASPFGRPTHLRLDYQVFLAPREVRVLEMPPVELRFTGSPRPQTLRIDAWPVTVAPLTPAEPSPRTGLGEMRPDREPPPVDTRATQGRLFVEAALALALLGYLAHVYLVLPWSAQRRRPFGRVFAAVRALPAAPAARERRAVFERLHGALNETAGEVLFVANLDAFLARRPRFAPAREPLARFFAASRDEFFGAGGMAVDGRWLVGLARRLRDLERGAA